MKPAAAHGDEDRLREPLSESESRILRYLPTNLSVPEIATEVYLSVNTVKTHMRPLYGKLGAHRRSRPSSGLAPSACLHLPASELRAARNEPVAVGPASHVVRHQRCPYW